MLEVIGDEGRGGEPQGKRWGLAKCVLLKNRSVFAAPLNIANRSGVLQHHSLLNFLSNPVPLATLPVLQLQDGREEGLDRDFLPYSL